MFNKFAKVIRWSILFGMLYTLYAITIKEDIDFKEVSDEKILVQLAADTNLNKEKYLIIKKINNLYPNRSEYIKMFDEILKIQANGLLDAHEKMMFPLAKGNYKYIDKIEFGKDKGNNYVLIFNLGKLFDTKVSASDKKTLKKMYQITHRGIYEHYGFDNTLKLLLSPNFDSKKDIEIIDLERVYEKEEGQIIPEQGKS